MADLNTEQTVDVDVETLMSMISRRVHRVPDAKYIMSAVERTKPQANSIVTRTIEEVETNGEGEAQPHLDRMGIKNRLKARVATLIIRAVRTNFRYQQVFNNSVVSVLQLIAEDLYAHQRILGATGLNGFDRPKAARFNHAEYEEKHLDSKAFCSRSLSLFREMLREDDVALNLFCGRGDLLATFAENGIKAMGVDSDAELVSRCRARGLRALQGNILEYLRDSPDGSCGGIFAWRMVERLTTDQTTELLELVRRKLRHGGIFVASATNIDHLPALKNFYLDPNLLRPVPVRLMEFMVDQSGLRLHDFRFSITGENKGEELSEFPLMSTVKPYDEYTIVAVND